VRDERLCHHPPDSVGVPMLVIMTAHRPITCMHTQIISYRYPGCEPGGNA
jgi:hypothetical protein